jgi:hypothetical protein
VRESLQKAQQQALRAEKKHMHDEMDAILVLNFLALLVQKYTN